MAVVSLLPSRCMVMFSRFKISGLTGSLLPKLSLVVLLLLASGCNRSNRTADKIARDTKQIEDFDNSLTFNSVTLEEFDSKGRLWWRVKAKQASYSKDRKIARIVEPSGEFFQDGKPIMKVSAQSGEVQKDGEQIFLKGKLKAIDVRDGLELKAEELEWQPRKDVVFVRNNVTGTHKKAKVTAKTGKFISRARRAELEGQVNAIAQDPTVQFVSDRLIWQLDKQTLTSDRPLQLTRYIGTTPTDKATANLGILDLKAKTAALKQNAQLTISDPPAQVGSNSLVWNLNSKTVVSEQPITIVNQQQQVTLVGNQGRMDLTSKIFYLTGGVQGYSQRNQSRVSSNTLTWNVTQEEFEAEGNVTYRQANPPFNLVGPKARGRLQDQTVVVSGGQTGGRVVTEFIPDTIIR